MRAVVWAGPAASTSRRVRAATTAGLSLDMEAAARRLAATTAGLSVDVEAACQQQGCAPDCVVAKAARRLAVEAAGLARDLAGAPGVVA
jgi:hypothetical protein